MEPTQNTTPLCNRRTQWDRYWVTPCFPFSYCTFFFVFCCPSYVSDPLSLISTTFSPNSLRCLSERPALAVLLGVEQKRINSQREREECIEGVWIRSLSLAIDRGVKGGGICMALSCTEQCDTASRAKKKEASLQKFIPSSMYVLRPWRKFSWQK